MDPAGSSTDGNITIYVAIFLFSLMLSAYFASAETAFAAVSKVRIRTLAEKGNKRAKTVLWITEHFDKTLTTVLIGNNIFHAASASVSALIVLRRFSSQTVWLGTLVTTLVVYLFAEMLPKSFAKERSEELALFYAHGLRFLVRVLTPLSALFSGISRLMARLFSASPAKTVTEEELINLIETIEDEGVLRPEKQALVNNAMQFRVKRVGDIMTPMADVVLVSSSVRTKELAKLVITLPYSRIPVYEGRRDNIVGILPVNRFLSRYTTGKPILLRKMLMKPYTCPKDTELSTLLHRMRMGKLHMIFVTDEKKNKIGIVTMEDLLEELVGEIQDESDTAEGLALV